MSRVVVANEYDLARNVGRYRRGEYARHLLFGVQSLEDAGWDVRFVGEGGPRPLRRRAVRTLLTNLRALVAGLRADVVYATWNDGALLAGAARALVGRPRRVVTVVHGVAPLLLRFPRLFALLYRGHDALLFLSPSHHARLAPALRAEQTAVWTSWGPGDSWVDDDAATEPPTGGLPEGGFALVVGKSKRDWDTLLVARALRPFPLVVLGGTDCPVEPGDGVVVHRPGGGGGEALTLPQLRALYRAAGVAVLPLLEDHSLNGSTALGEALASGTPVVMSSTEAMRGFADQYAGWVTGVPPGDPRALADAVHDALSSGPATTPPEVPSAEAFEAALHGVVSSRTRDESPPPG